MMTATEPAPFPYIALHQQTTGIHPASGRLLTLDAVTFDHTGTVGETFHAVFNPAGDPGPRHTHNLQRADFEQAPRFARYLKTLDKLIDGRHLILADSPKDFGFIVAEARRAMNAAARANRQRGRRGGRRRQRVGHVPQPESIIDLFANARRRGHILVDERLNAVANQIGVASEPATATAQRATIAEEDLSRAQTLKLVAMFLELRETGELEIIDPTTLAADKLGLQRAAIRVKAHKAEATAENPGVYTGGRPQPGMEVAISDDIAHDPNALIEAALDAGLTYVEKLTRTASLVVSDAELRGAELRGKAMHAHRKNIPVLSAEEFLTSLTLD